MNSDTELIFPLRLIPELAKLRGKPWQDLVQHLLSTDVSVADELAFGLLMVELCSCNSCNSYSFRAMRGCATCGVSAIQRYRENDEKLVALFYKKRAEITAYLETNQIDLNRNIER